VLTDIKHAIKMHFVSCKVQQPRFLRFSDPQQSFGYIDQFNYGIQLRNLSLYQN